MGSSRMYLLRIRTPMSKMRKQAARQEAVREWVKFHTLREQKGTTAQPSSVQPPRMPRKGWSL